MTATCFRVVGTVQGVGFRRWTRNTARSLGLVGYVRNVDDGSVEVFAIGDPDAIETFHAQLHEGPSGAIVLEVARTPARLQRLPSFEIA